MSIPRQLSANYVIGLSAIEKNEGMTSRDLVETMRIAKRNVMEYLKIWKTEGKIYIGGWRRDEGQGDWAPIYMIKPTPWHKDKVKPKGKTAAQRQREYRKRNEGLILARRLQKAGHKDAYNRVLVELMKGTKS